MDDRTAQEPEPPRGTPPTDQVGAGFPTPSETQAIGRAVLEETARRKRSAAIYAFTVFLRDLAQDMTGNGDDRTNIIDQGEKKTYALYETEKVRALFDHLEKCRLEGQGQHFSERQGTESHPRSGIMLDYDMYFRKRPGWPVLTDRHYHRLAARIVAQLRQDIEWAPRGSAGGAAAATEVLIHIFFIQKPEIATVTLENGETAFKYGFHILVPGVKLIRGYKRYLLRTLADDPAMVRLMNELGAMSPGGDPGCCLDSNSASVPVLFLGSCKRGGTPYTRGPAFEVTFDTLPIGGPSASDPYASPPIIRQLDGERLQGYNMVAELSITEEATYPDRPPLVQMAEYDYRIELQSVVETQGRRAVESGEVLFVENSLSTLTLTDPEARYLHCLLDILDPSFYADRNKWRNVIFALANTSDRYRPLAEWFSSKYGKWRDGTSKRIAAFDRLWDEAVARRGFVENPLTTGSIIHWAKQCNLQKFRDIMDKNYFEILAKYVYDYGGELEHFMIAKVLYSMLGNKFVVDVGKGGGTRGRGPYEWFEFVAPGQAMRPGEVWKWRSEVKPDEIELYMSEQLPQVLEQIHEHIKEKLNNPPDDNATKYYQSLLKAFRATRKRIFHSGYKKGVIEQCCLLFRRRGFLDVLDRDGTLLGCGNGVLRLGPAVELIDYFHEYPVQRFTPVPFVRFDPHNPTPTQQIVLDSYASNIPEPDARDLILFYFSTGLAGGFKEAKMLLWDGAGKNGKTSTLMLWKNTLGDDYGTKLPIQLLTDTREAANSPNSAKMRLKMRRLGFFEESEKSETLNGVTLKELVNPGEISASEKFQVQESFMLITTLVAASNYKYLINDAGHGLWRRLWVYTSKITYCTNPNPDSPFERKDDPRYAKQYATDPEFLVANLGILAYYYERLQREYGGDISQIACPTIERETEAYRNSQDMINRFIVERIVESPRPPENAPGDFLESAHGLGPIHLDALATKFTEWYNSNVERKRHVASEIIKDVENSALQKYIRRNPNDTLELRGCRVLDPDADGGMGLRPGETYIGAKAARKMNRAELVYWIREGSRGKWWLPRPADVAMKAPGAAADPLDDWLVLPGDVCGPGLEPRLDAAAVVDDFVGDDFLDEILGAAPARFDPGAYTLDDLYGE